MSSDFTRRDGLGSEPRRGEAYWPRTAISELHTAEQWRVQLGRQVLADQVERPVKTVPKRGYKPDAMDLEVPLTAACFSASFGVA